MKEKRYNSIILTMFKINTQTNFTSEVLEIQHQKNSNEVFLNSANYGNKRRNLMRIKILYYEVYLPLHICCFAAPQFGASSPKKKNTFFRQVICILFVSYDMFVDVKTCLANKFRVLSWSVVLRSIMIA